MNPCSFCDGTTSTHDTQCPSLSVVRAYYPDVSGLDAQLSARARAHRHHDVALAVLVEMVRGRYGAAMHTQTVIRDSVAVAKAYADAMYPLEGK